MSEAAMIGVFFVVFGFFEYVHPAQAGQGLTGRVRNICYGALVLGVGATISAWVFYLLPLSPRLRDETGVLATLVYAVAYVLAADLMFYWYHRAQHRFRSMWALHELHHSDSELNVLSSYRTYWLDYPIQTLVIHAPVLFILGYHPKGLVLAAALATFFLMFSHANWHLSLGRLTTVVVGPQLHRIHHSNLPNHRDKNFAQVFPVFDILFGTYYAPQTSEFPPTGTPTLTSDAAFARTLLRPFKIWTDMVRPRF
ncbi:sterol desaturase family protein [Meridianimarinicoccus aquatilis]|uniref:Sterol desaturase family protein n=1 Tax=Meridianimarinicoccus aquatilis TaxID=2552766 RepID=A0A4R6ASA1_9RHOB|nr:sterol desaturase family protein [Fluviibacterium aquatile]TDL86847.1 sterol desaturase family protein [Fluviibacterium aquatile]